MEISQHSPSGIMVFSDAQLVFGQEGGEQLDWPSWNSEYRHDRINSVLTTFHVHNDREKGAERKKEKDDRLFGKEEKKGKKKDETNQRIKERTNERSK